MSRGQRTLPHTIDELARVSGDKVWARYPVSPEAFERGELRAVTFSLLANAINRLARHLDIRLSGHENLETVCYFGPSDIRYFIVACAASKCRLKAFFSSPRNNLESHTFLLEETRCRTMLVSRETLQDSTIQSLIDKKELTREMIPSLEELLDPETVDLFPWDRNFDEVANEPFMVLHTTGSTGMPKPVLVSHGCVATVDSQQELPDLDGQSLLIRHWISQSVYIALPPFHSAGFNFFCFSVFFDTVLVLGPCDKPPSLSTVERILDSQAADAAFLPPSLVAEVTMDRSVLQKVSQWSSVGFGGGSLAKDAGDLLWGYTKVLQMLGSTETFNLAGFAPSSADEWEYHRYHPELGIEFRLYADSLYELVIVRNNKAKKYQGAFWTFPEEDEYSMKDLYEQHPSKPDRWKHRGRLDDILVLSNGEKFNPIEAERLIAQHEAVNAALVVGSGREQPAVLIDPAETPMQDMEQRQASIRQAIEDANERLPAHAQIHASHVRVLDSPDTFLRSSKGEVRRAPTVTKLRDQIAQVYDAAEDTTCPSQLDFSSEEKLRDSLSHLLSSEFFKSEELAKGDNIFERGLDSLQATKLLRHIKASIRDQNLDAGSNLTPRTIYQHPTVCALAKMMVQSLKGDVSDEDEGEEAQAEMQRLLDLFSGRIDKLMKDNDNGGAKIPPPDRGAVVLTGSTGSLGSYVLDSLIRTPGIDKIVCLNRPGGNTDKQAKINESRGLSKDFSKVEFLEVDLTKPELGLRGELYQSLARGTSHIIHNAWPINFNSPLSSFQPQLEACYNLIALAHASCHIVKTIFMSSVGAANSWSDFYDGPVPEQALGDLRVSESMGYAQSKQVAELLFVHASKRSHMKATVCRIGQIAGPVALDKGMWSPNEWFPSVMLSCKALGALPGDLGAMDCMDWTPVDLLSKMLVEAILADKELPHRSSSGGDLDAPASGSFSPSTTGSSTPVSGSRRSSQTSMSSSPESALRSSDCRFLHFVNPHKTYWRDMVDGFVKAEGRDVQVVPYQDWLKALVEAADTEGMAEDVPALKLVDFFRNIGRPDAKRPTFSTSGTEHASTLLREMSPVSLEWVRQWVSQWSRLN